MQITAARRAIDVPADATNPIGLAPQRAASVRGRRALVLACMVGTLALGFLAAMAAAPVLASGALAVASVVLFGLLTTLDHRAQERERRLVAWQRRLSAILATHAPHLHAREAADLVSSVAQADHPDAPAPNSWLHGGGRTLIVSADGSITLWEPSPRRHS